MGQLKNVCVRANALHFHATLQLQLSIAPSRLNLTPFFCSGVGESTTLQVAVNHNRTDLAALLLGCKADVNAQDEFAHTQTLNLEPLYSFLSPQRW